MENVLFIIAEVLSLAVIIALIVGQARLGRRIEEVRHELNKVNNPSRRKITNSKEKN